jgi:hypothetical protein
MFCAGLKKKSASCSLQNNMINNTTSNNNNNNKDQDDQDTKSSSDIYENLLDPNVNIILKKRQKSKRFSKLNSNKSIDKNKSSDAINSICTNITPIIDKNNKNDYSVYSMFKYDINNIKNNDVNLVDTNDDVDDDYEYIYYDNLNNQNQIFNKNVNRNVNTMEKKTLTISNTSLFKKLRYKSSPSIIAGSSIDNNTNKNNSSSTIFSYLKKKFKFGSSKYIINLNSFSFSLFSSFKKRKLYKNEITCGVLMVI